MSTSGDLRQEARECLARAKTLLARNQIATTRHACLELRQAIEYLAYQQLEAYLNEVPDDAMRKWTPREVIAQMLEVDPKADKTSTLAIGIEEVPGERSKGMKMLGEDRRVTLKWANRSHNALGNFLHAPTLHQLETGKVMNAHVVIVWSMIPNLDELQAVAILGKYLHGVGKWLEVGRGPRWRRQAYPREGDDLHYVWIHENAPERGFHTHIMLHLPFALRKEFDTWSRSYLARLCKTQFQWKAFRVVPSYAKTEETR